MKDQVEFLKSKNVDAEFFNSTLDKDQTTEFFGRLKTGQIKILYVAPERFRNERFMDNMLNVEVDMLAIDESHCISEWGHAFRPDYLLLKKAAVQLRVKRILCCTATATKKVAEDILSSFNIPSKNLIRTSFFRSNFRERLRVAEVNHYSMGRENDMRAGTLQLILVHLAVYGEYLEPLTPVKKQLMMHRYKILRQLDELSFTELVVDVYHRQQKREKR
jgi:superfamily II DNA helicase RecQ